MHRLDPQGQLLVVALGKYGGGEMSFGSDLDLLFLGPGEDSQRDEKVVRRLAKYLTHRRALGSIYEIDLRLRPHGQAGPLVPTLPALRKYFRKQAQNWEKQVLTRVRCVTGNPPQAAKLRSFLDQLIYEAEASDRELQELWNMRLRIERERDRTDPPQLAFKTGPGGIIEIEFFAQLLQLRHGHRYPQLREPNTRRLLRAIGELGLMDGEENALLLENLTFLKRVEVLLRRNRNAAVSVIGDSPEEQFALARWSGFKTRDEFWSDHCRCMITTRQIVRSFLSKEFAVASA
jgi:[glutamine synthetase] adenylyltransferase / [glutamine synthetase]-adenylyl-L-tyrosine phosphorylase